MMDRARSEAAARGIVIVGAGQAGGRAAEALRANGFEGDITMIGAEDELPYERPSLSKEMLIDHSCESIVWLQDPTFYQDNRITLRLGVAATSIDRINRQVMLSNGEQLDYGVLILATGSAARQLPMTQDLPNCFTLRSISDSRSLRPRLVEGQRIVVIGGGFIGLEVAAAAVTRACAVTVIEAEAAPLARILPPVLQSYFLDLHRAHGVAFELGAGVRAIMGGPDGVATVMLNGGERIDADTIVVGIGAQPNIEVARSAGLACDRGVAVDRYGATDDPLIFAAGDVASHYNPFYDRQVLLESWQNAQDQAIVIGRNIASSGEPEPYATLPWFWTDQYGINLQIYGLATPGAETVVRGQLSTNNFIVAQFHNQKIIFAAGVNSARDLRYVREIMKFNAQVSPETFADTSMSLPELLRGLRAVA